VNARPPSLGTEGSAPRRVSTISVESHNRLVICPDNPAVVPARAPENVIDPKLVSGSVRQLRRAQLDGASAIHSAELWSMWRSGSVRANVSPRVVSRRFTVTCPRSAKTAPDSLSPAVTVIAMCRIGPGASSYQAVSVATPAALQSSSVPSCSIADDLREKPPIPTQKAEKDFVPGAQLAAGCRQAPLTYANLVPLRCTAYPDQLLEPLRADDRGVAADAAAGTPAAEARAARVTSHASHRVITYRLRTSRDCESASPL
jgi:hypothetical protein